MENWDGSMNIFLGRGRMIKIWGMKHFPRAKDSESRKCPTPPCNSRHPWGDFWGVMETDNLGMEGETVIDETDLQIQPKGSWGEKDVDQDNSPQRWTHLVPIEPLE